MAYSSYAMNFPQISVDVDACQSKRAGISPASVLDVLGSYCGGAYISNYNQFGKVYRVMLQASPEYRLDEQALDNMFVRNGRRWLLSVSSSLLRGLWDQKWRTASTYSVPLP